MGTESTVLIGITGGIGAGKSMVSRILTTMGFPVYDTDSRAKTIMDESENIRRSIVEQFGQEVLCDERLDRRSLGQIVFNDITKLELLNGIVHAAVIDDVLRWKPECSSTVAFVESAILVSSGLSRYVENIWHVIAPEEVRIHRVMKRNGFSRQEVVSRISSQKEEILKEEDTIVLLNDDQHALVPQVLDALMRLDH